ncbi:MAG: adenine phosphoribosyltransferase [Acidimicrobiales bacterium]
MTSGEWLKDLIRDIPDFPEPGVIYKDITPLLGDVDALRFVVDAIVDRFSGTDVAKVLGIEARGFILAAPIAYRLGTGFVPVRKPGKLPHDVVDTTYELEYGTDGLAMHVDAVEAGSNVLIVDDVLATGGTAAATCELVDRVGANVVGCAFLAELDFLGGRSRLPGRELMSLVRFP